MAEEANDVQSTDITPDDFMADEQESPKADPSPAEEQKPEKASDEKPEQVVQPEGAKAEPEAKDAETEGKPEESEAEETAEEKPQGDKPLAPKSENRFQKLANENRALRDQVEQLTSEVYQPQTAEELVEETNPETGERYTPAEARVVALEQKLELKEYNEKVSGAQQSLSHESMQVLNDFPIFNPSSDQFNEGIAQRAAGLLENSLIRDPNVPEIGSDGQPTGKGLVIGSNVSPYQLYQTIADAAGISAQSAQLQGQQSAEKMLANADPTSSTAPPRKKTDPLTELWQGEL